MSSSFPSAAEYYNKLPPVLLGDATIGKQPDSTPPSHFGLQPEGLSKIDNQGGKRRRVVVLGAGDVWRKFAKWALDHRDTEYFVFSSDLREANTHIINQENLAKAGIDETHCLRSVPYVPGIDFIGADEANIAKFYDKIPEGIDCVIDLTPPSHHPHNIKWAQERGLPIMVEKPLVNHRNEFTGVFRGISKSFVGSLSNKQFQGLDDLLENPTASVFCMDWMAAHALPLAAVIGSATGSKVPFADAVHYKNQDQFKAFDFDHITRIEGRLVEKYVKDGFGDMEYVEKNRPMIYLEGTLKDMAVHPMAALADMGFMPGAITNVILGDTKGQKEPGIYRRVGNKGEDIGVYKHEGHSYRNGQGNLQRTADQEVGGVPTPAWYARAEMISHFRNQEIPTLIEVGKAAAHDHSGITMTDKNGSVLHWELGQDKSEVTLRLKGKSEPVATAYAQIDPYALMFEEAKQHFDREKNSPQKTALHYQSQRAILHAIVEMERIGRLTAAEPAETVSQLPLAPSPVVDLANAAVASLNPRKRR